MTGDLAAERPSEQRAVEQLPSPPGRPSYSDCC